jgi:hypothetical protein
MTKKILLGIGLLFVFIVIYRLTVPKPLTRDECYRLESNLRMLACLEEIDRREGLIETPEPSPDLYVGPEQISVLSAESSSGRNAAMFVTVKNNSSFRLKSVALKISYHPPEAKSCTGNPLDTENLSFSEVVDIGDTKLLTIYPESLVFQRPHSFCVSAVGGEKL